MLINEAGVVRAVKRAYKGEGYTVNVRDGIMSIYTQSWYIQARREVMPPNDPLTLEELREMDGEPVWVVALDYGASRWAFVSADCEVVRYFTTRRGVACDVIGRHFRTYGKTWVAYRRKPEE